MKHKLYITERNLRGAEERIKQLEAYINRLVFQLAPGQTVNRANATLVGEVLGDPFAGPRATHQLARPMPSMSPVVARNGVLNSQLSPSAEPYTPTMKRAPTEPPAMTSDSGAPTGRRHKRTETPEQLFLRPYTNGVPIYTLGIDPQDERGLLHDFFTAIQNWAKMHTKDLNVREVIECMKIPELVKLLAGKSNIKHLLVDKEMRIGIVTALITQDIIEYTLGEQFLINSNHPASQQCHALLLEFANLSKDDYEAKHEICRKQNDLYSKIDLDPNRKKWRTRVSEDLCQKLLHKISCLLEPGMHPERDHVLSELYVKGYRIAFRFRTQDVKWHIVWPKAGTDLNLTRMVNQTRHLFGDTMTTLTRLQEDPMKFFVRFALTPTFTKSYFSPRGEKKDVIHSSLVHIGRKGVFSHKDDSKL